MKQKTEPQKRSENPSSGVKTPGVGALLLMLHSTIAVATSRARKITHINKTIIKSERLVIVLRQKLNAYAITEFFLITTASRRNAMVK